MTIQEYETILEWICARYEEGWDKEQILHEARAKGLGGIAKYMIDGR